MDFRKDELEGTMQALQDLGQPLVMSVNNGAYVRAAGYTDDLGIYYLIPKLADFLGLTITQGSIVFFLGLLFIGFALGVVGILLFFRDWLLRWIVAALFVTFYIMVSLAIQDVYILGFVITFSVIPLSLYLNRENMPKRYAIFLFLSGMAVALSFYIRNFSSLPVAIIVIWMLYFQSKYNNKQKLVLLISFLVGVLLVILHFKFLIAKRDTYLAEYHQHDTQTYMTDGHILWHNVYIGFGYYENPYGIEYSDHIADEKAKSIKPDVVYMSNEYNIILRGAVIDFVKREPVFVVEITVKKLRDIIRRMPTYIWFGMLLAVLTTRQIISEMGFWLALFIGILPGLLVHPGVSYISSFVGLAFIYAFIGYERAWNRYMVTHNKHSMIVT